MRERRGPDGRRAGRVALAASLAVVAAGCAVGPDYRTPAIGLDAGYVNDGVQRSNAEAPGEDIATFWRGFGDDLLSSLVEAALAAGYDVRIAAARLQESRADLRGAEAALLPEVDVTAGASRARQPQYLLPGASAGDRTFNVYDAGFTALWELDFFGRNRRARESAAALVDASAAGVHAAQTSLAAEVARNYLELRGLQERYAVALQSIANQRDTLRLTRARLEAGRGTRLDASRAQSQLDSTEATLPVLQAGIARTAYRLATLSARSPRAVLDSVAEARPLPSLPVTDLGSLPIGTPEQLLRRRPDLVGAERELAAATAQIGVATADLFPRVSLSGLLGLATTSLGGLDGSGARQFSLGASLSWPLLDFGRVRSRIAASEARALQSLARYEQSVAGALEEVEGALAQFTRDARQVERLASAARYAEDAERLARVRFDAGVVDFLIVLDAQRQTLAARDALAVARAGQATALVAVYRALGGGWQAGPVAVAKR